MKFSLAVYASPFATDSARTALHFAQAVLDGGDELYRIFFFSEGVLNGVAAAEDGTSKADLLRREWQALVEHAKLDAVVCVNSAQKRSIGIDTETDGRLPLASGFVVGGLGQLIDARVNSDRFITFGP
ncbi:sulfurtransferase complex subunit TusD [Gilvimarinus sp. F26214L]|uniref:sulfurtransferase complex subunit TusD n=1 Tax=Gilvimarinus sp. DZF01 TaxID=3461371 RepID=UPI004045CE21